LPPPHPETLTGNAFQRIRSATFEFETLRRTSQDVAPFDAHVSVNEAA
jgi:hypothetical protein